MSLIMDTHIDFNSCHSLLERLTLQIASEVDEENRRKISIQSVSNENKFIREPPPDIDKELTDLENLIKNLQVEIFEMTKNASKPLEEYVYNKDDCNIKSDIIKEEIDDNKNETSTVGNVNQAYPVLLHDSNVPTTSKPSTLKPKVSTGATKEIDTEIFNSSNFAKDFTNYFNTQVYENEDVNAKKNSQPSDKDEVIIKNTFDENFDTCKNTNIRTGLIMRILGDRNNTKIADDSRSNSQTFINIFKNKTPTNSSDTNKIPKETVSSNSVNINNNVSKAKADQLEDCNEKDTTTRSIVDFLTKIGKSFKSEHPSPNAEVNQSKESLIINKHSDPDTDFSKNQKSNDLPKTNTETASNSSHEPTSIIYNTKQDQPKDITTQYDSQTSSIMNFLSRVEHNLSKNESDKINNENFDSISKNNNNSKKTDTNIIVKQSKEPLDEHQHSNSNTDVTHKLSTINIFIHTQKPRNFELPEIENNAIFTKVILKIPNNETSSTSIKSRDPTTPESSNTDLVLVCSEDNVLQDSVNLSTNNMVTNNFIKKGNGKSACLLHSFNESNFHKDTDSECSEITSSNTERNSIKRTSISEPNIFKSRGNFESTVTAARNKVSNKSENEIENNLCPKNTLSVSEKTTSDISYNSSTSNAKSETKITNALSNKITTIDDLFENGPNTKLNVHSMPDNNYEDGLDNAVSDNIPNEIHNNSIENSPGEKPRVFIKTPNSIEKLPVLSRSPKYEIPPVSSAQNVDKDNDSFENDDLTDEYESLADDDDGSIPDEVLFKNRPIYVSRTRITLSNVESGNDVFEDSQDFENVTVNRKQM